MIRTRVGYAGGKKDAPTYRDLGDHSEAIEIDFDPKKISYEELLGHFWKGHDPCGAAFSRQYRSAIFVHDEEQRRVAERTRGALVVTRAIQTAIEPATRFWLAERYHQKYYLQQRSWLAEHFDAVHDTAEAFVADPAATRLNAWIGGHLDAESLERELPGWKLPAAIEARLREQLRERAALPAGAGAGR